VISGHCYTLWISVCAFTVNMTCISIITRVWAHPQYQLKIYSNNELLKIVLHARWICYDCFQRDLPNNKSSNHTRHAWNKDGQTNLLFSVRFFVFAPSNLDTFVHWNVKYKLMSSQDGQCSHHRPQMEVKSSVTFLCICKWYREIYFVFFL